MFVLLQLFQYRSLLNMTVFSPDIVMLMFSVELNRFDRVANVRTQKICGKEEMMQSIRFLDEP